MRCLILSGGDAPDSILLNEHIERADYIIGVDGAADTLYGCGVIPDVLIGDFDTADASSVEALERKGASVIRLNNEKDETDTEAAIDFAVSKGASNITILGALGGRLDHLLSNLMMMVRAHKAGVECSIEDERCELFVSDSQFVLSGHPGQTVSILPLTGEITVNAIGLEYPLENLLLKWGSSRGISNVMQGDTAHISISGGYALIVKIKPTP